MQKIKETVIVRKIFINLFITVLVVAAINALVRDAEATTCRSQTVRNSFIHKNPKAAFLAANSLPSGTILWVDHICALECGGLDIPANMQYQTRSDAIAKDRWERTAAGCTKTCNSTNSLPGRTVFNCK